MNATDEILGDTKTSEKKKRMVKKRTTQIYARHAT